MRFTDETELVKVVITRDKKNVARIEAHMIVRDKEKNDVAVVMILLEEVDQHEFIHNTCGEIHRLARRKLSLFDTPK